MFIKIPFVEIYATTAWFSNFDLVVLYHNFRSSSKTKSGFTARFISNHVNSAFRLYYYKTKIKGVLEKGHLLHNYSLHMLLLGYSPKKAIESVSHLFISGYPNQNELSIIIIPTK